MADFNKQILGKVSGALGGVTFRERNGKTYISTRPGSFTPGSDVKSVARRERFSLSIKLAKSINAVPLLNVLWAKDTPQGFQTYNYIMKTNYPAINPPNLTDLVKIVPSLGFNVSNPVVALGPNSIKVNIDAIGNSTGISAAEEPSFKLVSIVYLSNPSDASLSKGVFLTSVSDAKSTDLAAALEFNIALSDVETQMLALYQNRKGFFAVISLDAAGNAVHFSNTFVG